ncbi:MAG: LysM peptidoglycan-binding domain-containing protein, partial [Candidatus Aureabacteria bacterium]|nr:LysM peptidoglycan-binding domain-containing protein [Candidatus Auribacterota bacterium]
QKRTVAARRAAVAQLPPAAGQKRSEPRAMPGLVRRYQVARGDSLRSLALKFYGSSDRWKVIYDANRSSLAGKNALQPGMVLVIPQPRQ